MKSKHISGVLVILLLTLTSCTSTENLIETEYNALSHSDSILLYEQAFTSSSATGACAGTSIDRWYGSRVLYVDLIKAYESQLPSREWVLWPKDAVRVWRKETKEGVFSLSLSVITGTDRINPDQVYYRLPDSVLLEAAKYPTIYIIHLNHLYPSAAKRCFGK